MTPNTREQWEGRYEQGDTPWETGKPSSELLRVVAEQKITPCKALEMGCGTGASSVWLAQQGFAVTAVDISLLAIDRARERAAAVEAQIHFVVADLRDPPAELTGPFEFLFDRGCYHVIRRTGVEEFLRTLEKVTRPGTLALFLTGNANEPEQPGPPVVSEEEIRREIGSLFEIVQLREFRFDETPMHPTRPLAWSCLARRKA